MRAKPRQAPRWCAIYQRVASAHALWCRLSPIGAPVSQSPVHHFAPSRALSLIHMTSLDDMLERARRMEVDPSRSKLDDYAQIVWELRRKRKRVRTITAFLNEHGVRVHRATVARWLKAHPVPAVTPAEKAFHPLVPVPAPCPAIEQASQDFFKPRESKHENHNEPDWNRPD